MNVFMYVVYYKHMSEYGSSSFFSHDTAHLRGLLLKKYGLEPIILTPTILVCLLLYLNVFDVGAIAGTFATLTFFSPVWLPVFLGKFFWISWIEYVRYKYWFKQDYAVLEIQLPQEVEKSPLAMETFLTTLFNSGGEATIITRMWNGGFRPIWSLEIASNEGRVSFYLRVPKGLKNNTETRLYGQFPSAKILEVDDYAAKVPFNLDEYDLWGLEYDKGQPHALPVKTYIDFKLDKDQKEEYRVDPITHILELFAGIGRGEYLWTQIVMKARKQDEWFGFYYNLKSKDNFKDPAKNEIKSLMKASADRAQEIIGETQFKMMAILSEGERRKVDAMERSMSKPIFECGIRTLYFAKKENFDGSNIPGIIGLYTMLRGSGEYNFIPPSRGMVDFDYPWQDFKDTLKSRMKRKLFFRFKHRAFFYVPYNQVPIFLNIEELATMWHFPGSGVKTPGLNRVTSSRAEAPSNLPTLPE